jgi:hypothetical protein
MDTPSDSTLLARGVRRLAQRLEVNEATMAWVLARLRERTGATDRGIATRLGLAEDRLPHLALCNRPRSDLFREDVEAIAEHFSIVPRRLADLVREVETLERFRPAAERPVGLLAAARDRVAEDERAYDDAPATAGGAGDAAGAAPDDRTGGRQ